MESCAGRVIVLARLDGRLLLAPLARRDRLLEAGDRRAESAFCPWQSLGAEYDQRDGENHQQVCGAEDVFDRLWSVLLTDAERRPQPPRALLRPRRTLATAR